MRIEQREHSPRSKKNRNSLKEISNEDNKLTEEEGMNEFRWTQVHFLLSFNFRIVHINSKCLHGMLRVTQ